MKCYLTEEDHPVRTNCPQPEWILISDIKVEETSKEYLKRCEKEYKRICKERNDKIEKIK